MGLRPFRLTCLVLSSLVLIALLSRNLAGTGYAQSGGQPSVYLPLMTRGETLNPAPRVNAPGFDGNISFSSSAILWFGSVTPSENYADVRVGYNNSELRIILLVFDRLTWYDGSPSPADLTDWDAVTLLLDKDGNLGSVTDSNSYRFVGQMRWWETPADYQATYQGAGSSWNATAVPFTTESSWVSDNLPNDNQDDRGWVITFHIPFTSLGLTGPPAQGSSWGLGLALHDRDSAAGPPLAVKSWPEALSQDRPSTWGQLVFGLPAFTPPSIAPTGSTSIRQGLNGAVVKDAHVGGHTLCGEEFNPNFFNGWGDRNFAGYQQVNIQNQGNLGDWPCFSKYYITFPLEGIPVGKIILSAKLTMYQFGNSSPSEAHPSIIQVLTINEDWNEDTITWNNAPYAWENVGRASVGVLPSYPGLPGIAREWDLSRAVTEAYQKGVPLRLAMYSADGAMHSGKYFYSSNMDDYTQTSRPLLTITWGDQ
jgi:hypothetical protein